MKFLLAALSLSFMVSANASIITFENVGTFRPGEVHNEGDLSFSTVGNEITYFSITDQVNIVGNGSLKLAAANKNVISISSSTGPFSIASLEAGGFWTNPSKFFMSATGLVFEGISETERFTYAYNFDSYEVLELIDLPSSFQNLQELVVSPLNTASPLEYAHDYYSFVLDNISYSIAEVSEASSAFLVLLLMPLLTRRHLDLKGINHNV